VTGLAGPTVVRDLPGTSEEVSGTELGNTTGESEASCEATEKLVGGGARTTATGGAVRALVTSYPEENEWFAQATVVKAGAPGSKITVTAYALCAS
jgi:hypothetical protein